MRPILLATFAVAIGSAQVEGEPAEMDPQDVKLTLKLAEVSPVFRIGEPIRVKMLFTSSTRGSTS